MKGDQRIENQVKKKRRRKSMIARTLTTKSTVLPFTLFLYLDYFALSYFSFLFSSSFLLLLFKNRTFTSYSKYTPQTNQSRGMEASNNSASHNFQTKNKKKRKSERKERKETRKNYPRIGYPQKDKTSSEASAVCVWCRSASTKVVGRSKKR